MKRVPFSFFRLLLIARYTVREAARQRLFHFLALLAFVLVVGAQWFRELNFGSSELKFLADLGFGAIAFFGAALTITATAQLFFGEIEQRTVHTLLAKPVWRSEFVLGKFLGVVAVLAVFCGVLTVALAAVLWSRETVLMQSFPDAFTHGRAVDYAAVFAAGFGQWLKLAVLAALTLLIASFAQTQLFTVVSGFLVLVICQLQFVAQEAAQRGGFIVWRGLVGLVALALPDFQVFDFSDAIGAGDALPWRQLAGVTLYGTAYVAVGCGLAAFSFRKREI